jgi:hypothetical protein
VQFYAFDMLAGDGDDMRPLPLSIRKANLARLIARRSDGIFIAQFELGEIGPDLFRTACGMGLEGWSRSTGTGIPGRTLAALGKGERTRLRLRWCWAGGRRTVNPPPKRGGFFMVRKTKRPNAGEKGLGREVAGHDDGTTR